MEYGTAYCVQSLLVISAKYLFNRKFVFINIRKIFMSKHLELQQRPLKSRLIRRWSQITNWLLMKICSVWLRPLSNVEFNGMTNLFCTKNHDQWKNAWQIAFYPAFHNCKWKKSWRLALLYFITLKTCNNWALDMSCVTDRLSFQPKWVTWHGFVHAKYCVRKSWNGIVAVVIRFLTYPLSYWSITMDATKNANPRGWVFRCVLASL